MKVYFMTLRTYMGSKKSALPIVNLLQSKTHSSKRWLFLPGGPAGPCFPSLPGSPTLPGGPARPWGPGSPFSPRGPGRPGGPGQDRYREPMKIILNIRLHTNGFLKSWPLTWWDWRCVFNPRVYQNSSLRLGRLLQALQVDCFSDGSLDTYSALFFFSFHRPRLPSSEWYFLSKSKALDNFSSMTYP